MAKSSKTVKTAAKADTTEPQPTAHPIAVTLLDKKWLPQIILILAAVIVYFSSLSNGLVFFDDDKAILYNHALQNPTLYKFFTGQNLGMYAPVSWIAYWIGSFISGKEADGYHLLSLIFHAISGCLVFSIILHLTRRSWLAFFVALLFVVHPIQVEAVSWAAALSTALFALFYLGAYRAYLQYTATERPSYGWLLLSYFLFTASVLSKSAAVTLPVLLIATDFLFHRDRMKNLWKDKIFYFIVALWFGYKTFLTRQAEGHNIETVSAIFGLSDRFFMVCQTLLFYPAKLLAPFGFSIAYPFDKTNGAWNWAYYAAPAALLGIAVLVWKTARHHREVLYGLALYLIPLAVMLPLRTVGSFELRSDRYAYVSCVGIFLLLGLLLEKTTAAIRVAMTIGISMILAFLAFEQTTVWKDGVQLFENCVEKVPQSSLCQCNLAYNELIRSDFQNSAEHYSEALRLDPKLVEAFNGRGQAYLNLKKPTEALDDFTKAVQAGISSPKLFFNKGKCLVLLNRAIEAIPDLTKSLELEPNNAEAFYLRGFAQEKNNAPELAIKDYGQAILLNPSGIEPYVNRGLLHYKKQAYQQAVDDYTAAININPNIAMVFNNRANAYLNIGQKNKALADVEQALKINPEYKLAQETRARIRGI